MTTLLKLDHREVCTIADLVSKALERSDDWAGLYERRSLIRLALVLDQLGRPRTRRWMILSDAPRWVYQYLAKPIIELVEPVQRRRKAKPKVSGGRKAGGRPGARLPLPPGEARPGRRSRSPRRAQELQLMRKPSIQG